MLRKTILTGLLALATLPAATPAQAAVDPGTGTEYSTTPVVVPITFPVVGATSYSDNYLACRSGCARKHMGQDLMGAKMSPLVAAFDGVVTTMSRDGGSGNYVGITATSGPAAGWTAMYLHVNNDTPGTDDGRGTEDFAFPRGIEVGSRVVAGQLVAWRGDSGNAESTGPHLHFELRKGEGWGGVVHNAYPSLRAARRLSVPLPSGPHPDGTVVRLSDGSSYLLQAGSKHPITRAVMAINGYAQAAVVRIPAAEARTYPTSTWVRPRAGAVVVGPDDRSWTVVGQSRVRGWDFVGRLAGAPAPTRVGLADLLRLPIDTNPLASLTGLLDGTLLRVAGTAYRVEDGVLRAFAPGAGGSWGLRPAALLDLPALPELPVGEPVGLRDGTLVRTPTRLGVVSGGRFLRIWDDRMVTAYGYRGVQRLALPDSALAGLPEAELTSDPSRSGGRNGWRD